MNAKDALARLHAATTKHRQSMRGLEMGLLRKATITVTSAGYGAMRKHAVPMSIKGFPWKLGVWLAATVTEVAVKSPAVVAIAGAIGDTSLASYTEGAVASGQLIAGEDAAQV